MVPVDEATVQEKGALGPGQMIAVDMAEKRLFRDADLKDKLAAAQPFGDWVSRVTDLDTLMRDVREAPMFDPGELRRRQIAAGYTMEEVEQVLAPMAEDGKEMIALGLEGGYDAAKRLCEDTELAKFLANIGDARTLVVHPASTTHAQLSEAEQRESGVAPEMVRLSIGIEDVTDIVADLEGAL